MSELTAIIGIADRMARGNYEAGKVWEEGDRFWLLVDNAEDEEFENHLKGVIVSDMDNALMSNNISRDTNILQFFGIFDSWFRRKHGMDFDDFLKVNKLRISESFAFAYTRATGKPISPVNCFGKGLLTDSETDVEGQGLHEYGRLDGVSTWAAGKSYGAAGKIVCVTEVATPNASDLIMKCTRFDGTTVNIEVEPDTALDSQVVVGETDIASVSSNEVLIADTSPFKIGEPVLLESATAIESAIVVDMTEDTSVELDSISGTFTTGDKIIPTFRNIAYESGVIGSEKSLLFVAMPDRLVEL